MIKNRLKIVLAERDMNMSDLAELTGIHYTTIRRFAGDEIVSIHKATLSRICAVLALQPGDLFIYVPDAPTTG